MNNDRKCALACFQAKTKAQRLRALAAGFSRMGLCDHCNYVLTLIGEPAAPVKSERGARASSARTKGSRAPTIPSDLPSSSSTSLASRITSLETWAHTLDSTLHEDGQSGESLVRASELLAALAKQVSHDYPVRRMEAIEQDIGVLQAAAQRQQPPPEDRQDSAAEDQATLLSSMQADLDLLCSKVATLERQTLKSDEFAVFSFRDLKQQVVLLRATSDHTAQLLHMHTQAIRQSWQWIISVIQATQQLALRSAPTGPMHGTHSGPPLASQDLQQSLLVESARPLTSAPVAAVGSVPLASAEAASPSQAVRLETSFVAGDMVSVGPPALSSGVADLMPDSTAAQVLASDDDDEAAVDTYATAAAAEVDLELADTLEVLPPASSFAAATNVVGDASEDSVPLSQQHAAAQAAGAEPEAVSAVADPSITEPKHGQWPWVVSDSEPE
eukprot:6479181-Amphidinium_carterae.2